MGTCCGFSCGNGCNGGYLSGAWNYFKNSGIVTGYLYNDTKYCSSYAFAPCDHHTTGKYGPCGKSQPTPACKKQCASGYEKSYSDDKIHAKSVYGGALGGHAIKIVGWGVEDGTPYWKVANSWNEGWGDNGYFKILRGKNECGIEGQIVAGMVNLQA